MQAGKKKNFRIFSKKLLTKRGMLDIIIKHCSSATNKYGGIAQLARAFGSYPKCHVPVDEVEDGYADGECPDRRCGVVQVSGDGGTHDTHKGDRDVGDDVRSG